MKPSAFVLIDFECADLLAFFGKAPQVFGIIYGSFVNAKSIKGLMG
jgi:hypothetical protein